VKDKSLVPPDATSGDRIHSLLRGTISGLPVVGGLAGELFSMLLKAPLETRRDNWMWDIMERIRKIEMANPQRVSELVQDPTFTSVLVQATQAAFRANRDEKVELLKNAVTQSAAGIDIDSDLQVTFVRYLDELTPSHIAVLSAMANSERNLVTLRSWESVYGVVAATMAPTGIDQEAFQLFCSDLRSRLLIRASDDLDDFDDVAHGPARIAIQGEPAGAMIRVTGIGRQFLAFVSRDSTP
jgi:hypothetical protein